MKWPNDVLIDGRKVAGILVEARPAEGWAVLGIGLNAALDVGDLPPELRETAATLGRAPAELDAVLAELLAASRQAGARRTRRASRRCASATRCSTGRSAGTAARAWAPGSTTRGRLLVRPRRRLETVLDAGEVHLGR